MAAANPAAFSGLEFLATAVVVLDGGYVVRHTNQAAENLLGAGARSLVGQAFPNLFTDRRALEGLLADALAVHWSYRAQIVSYERAGREPLPLSCVVAPIDAPGMPLLAELRPIREQLRLERGNACSTSRRRPANCCAISRTRSRIPSAACAAPRSCSNGSWSGPS